MTRLVIVSVDRRGVSQSLRPFRASWIVELAMASRVPSGDVLSLSTMAGWYLQCRIAAQIMCNCHACDHSSTVVGFHLQHFLSRRRARVDGFP
jgi:hypothetical protein